jgi:hypothetical protein
MHPVKFPVGIVAMSLASSIPWLPVYAQNAKSAPPAVSAPSAVSAPPAVSAPSAVSAPPAVSAPRAVSAPPAGAAPPAVAAQPTTISPYLYGYGSGGTLPSPYFNGYGSSNAGTPYFSGYSYLAPYYARAQVNNLAARAYSPPVASYSAENYYAPGL